MKKIGIILIVLSILLFLFLGYYTWQYYSNVLCNNGPDSEPCYSLMDKLIIFVIPLIVFIVGLVFYLKGKKKGE